MLRNVALFILFSRVLDPVTVPCCYGESQPLTMCTTYTLLCYQFKDWFILEMDSTLYSYCALILFLFLYILTVAVPRETMGGTMKQNLCPPKHNEEEWLIDRTLNDVTSWAQRQITTKEVNVSCRAVEEKWGVCVWRSLSMWVVWCCVKAVAYQPTNHPSGLVGNHWANSARFFLYKLPVYVCWLLPLMGFSLTELRE